MKKILALNFKMNLNYDDVKIYKENINGKINEKDVIFFIKMTLTFIGEMHFVPKDN